MDRFRADRPQIGLVEEYFHRLVRTVADLGHQVDLAASIPLQPCAGVEILAKPGHGALALAELLVAIRSPEEKLFHRRRQVGRRPLVARLVIRLVPAFGFGRWAVGPPEPGIQEIEGAAAKPAEELEVRRNADFVPGLKALRIVIPTPAERCQVEPARLLQPTAEAALSRRIVVHELGAPVVQSHFVAGMTASGEADTADLLSGRRPQVVGRRRGESPGVGVRLIGSVLAEMAGGHGAERVPSADRMRVPLDDLLRETVADPPRRLVESRNAS